MKEFFTKEFLALDNKNKWDALTAMRGPDAEIPAGLERLKELVTARIRALIVADDTPVTDIDYSDPDSFVAGYLYNNTVMTEGEAKEVVDRVNAMSTNHFHFLNHLRKAMAVFVNSPIWGGYGDAILIALKRR